ncbi:MAG: amidohydrolase family protein [Bacteroidia bacterium]
MLQNDREMYLSGIVVAGDICNTDSSFDVKTQSLIRYFSFCRGISPQADRAESAFNKGLELLGKARNLGLHVGITAHAPYSASAGLMHKIAAASRDEGYPMSIHFQESAEELEFISTGGGKMAERIERMGIDISDYEPVKDGQTGWLLKNAATAQKIIAVHNTWSSPEDVTRLNLGFRDVSFCLCPSANLYIGGKLPSIDFIIRLRRRFALEPTAWLNTAPDMLQEMQILQSNFNLNLKTLIPWASLNGAKALGIDSEFGSFTKGKKPGIVHLSKVNHKELLILPDCRSRII